jgi:hypothetical protein
MQKSRREKKPYKRVLALPDRRAVNDPNEHAINGFVNLGLAAVRRIAYEAADSGLLSPELAAGIPRVKGVRRIGATNRNYSTGYGPSANAWA